MKIFSKALAVILLLASVVFLAFAFGGHEAAWSNAAACSCSAAVIISTNFFGKKNKNR